ncbi:Asd/ArgC dimerization domain-containing protein [Escherichia coli]
MDCLLSNPTYRWWCGSKPVCTDRLRNRNVIAVPDSLTSQLLAALKPLIDQGGLSRISLTGLISASAKGKKAVDALAGQSAKLLNGIPIDEEDFSGVAGIRHAAVLPDSEGSVREERRIVDEVRKILQDEGLMIRLASSGTGILRSCPDGQL